MVCPNLRIGTGRILDMTPLETRCTPWVSPGALMYSLWMAWMMRSMWVSLDPRRLQRDSHLPTRLEPVTHIPTEFAPILSSSLAIAHGPTAALIITACFLYIFCLFSFFSSIIFIFILMFNTVYNVWLFCICRWYNEELIWYYKVCKGMTTKKSTYASPQ